MKKVVVIDAFNFILIAAAAAFKHPEDSELYYHITSTMIMKLKKMFYNSEFYACWDEWGGTQFRKDIDENYKKGRTTINMLKPSEVAELKELFTSYGIKNISCPETEADDVIFCLCKILKEKGPTDITIITRDRDLIQVVQKGYANRIYDYVRKTYIEIPWYDIVLYKSLVGDSSDHLIGVRGIGPKNAVKIITEYNNTGTLKLTEEQKEQFEKSRKIIDATLHPRLEENLTKLRNEFV